MEEREAGEKDEAGGCGGSWAGAAFLQTGGRQRWMRRSCCLESEAAAAAQVGEGRIKRPPLSPSHHTAAAAAKLVGSESERLMVGGGSRRLGAPMFRPGFTMSARQEKSVTYFGTSDSHPTSRITRPEITQNYCFFFF